MTQRERDENGRFIRAERNERIRRNQEDQESQINPNDLPDFLTPETIERFREQQAMPRITFNSATSAPVEFTTDTTYTPARITPKKKEPITEKKVNVNKNGGKKVLIASNNFVGSISRHIPEFTVADPRSMFIPGAVKEIDMVIFTGGEDIDPTYYSENNVLCHSANRVRDNQEMGILRYAREFRKKIVGFCRGLQLINVGLGGSLYQDFVQMGNFNYHPSSHPIKVESNNTIIGKYFGDKEVISMHHQSIKQLAQDSNVKLRVTSTYGGVVESIEGFNIVATQFHPEFESPEKVKDFFKFLVYEW